MVKSNLYFEDFDQTYLIGFTNPANFNCQQLHVFMNVKISLIVYGLSSTSRKFKNDGIPFFPTAIRGPKNPWLQDTKCKS